jgi:inorganic pyrophosphatase
LNDIDDIERLMPGLLDSTRDWFKIYKIPTGKPANSFAENGKIFNRDFALKQIEHDYKLWKNLVNGGYDATPDKQKGIALSNTSLEKNKLDEEAANRAVDESSTPFNEVPAFIEQGPIDEVHYVDRSKL